MNKYFKTVIQNQTKWEILVEMKTLTRDDPAIAEKVKFYQDQGIVTCVNTYWIDETKVLPWVPGGYTSGT